MKRTLFAIFIIFLLGTSSSFAADWYVDNGANGANNGTSWTHAWESFSSTNWSVVSPGDTLYISGGYDSKTYFETLSIGASGTPGHPVTIRVGQTAGHNGRVIIDGQNSRQRCIFGGNHDYVTIDGNYNGSKRIRVTKATHAAIDFNGGSDGITIRYIQVYDSGTVDNEGHGIRIFRGVDSEIAYCDIDNIWQDGIQVRGQFHISTGWGQNCEIHHNTIKNICDDAITFSEGNDVHDNIIGPWRDSAGHGDDPHPDGIQYYGGWNRFWNNVFQDTLNTGSNAFLFMDMDGAHDTAHHRIYNNIFMLGEGAYAGHRWVGVAMKTEGTSTSIEDVLVANNTFVDLGGHAIRLNPTSASHTFRNIVVKNNLIYNCFTASSYGSVIYLRDGDYSTGDVIVEANQVHNGTAGTQNMEYDGTRYTTVSSFNAATGFSNTYCAPSFVHYYPGGTLDDDLHLDSSNTCAIDQGENLSEFFNFDKDGITRPQGSGWDIGAYEYYTGYVSVPEPPKNLRVLE